MFEKIRKIVSQIPGGKVLTYGDVARLVSTKDARKVGWALHGNQDPNIPCHRVVQAGGTLAENYSMGTWTEQKSRLQSEGVRFITDRQIDMTVHHLTDVSCID
mgnify:FL=1